MHCVMFDYHAGANYVAECLLSSFAYEKRRSHAPIGTVEASRISSVLAKLEDNTGLLWTGTSAAQMFMLFP